VSLVRTRVYEPLSFSPQRKKAQLAVLELLSSRSSATRRSLKEYFPPSSGE